MTRNIQHSANTSAEALKDQIYTLCDPTELDDGIEEEVFADPIMVLPGDVNSTLRGVSSGEALALLEATQYVGEHENYRNKPPAVFAHTIEFYDVRRKNDMLQSAAKARQAQFMTVTASCTFYLPGMPSDTKLGKRVFAAVDTFAEQQKLEIRTQMGYIEEEQSRNQEKLDQLQAQLDALDEG